MSIEKISPDDPKLTAYALGELDAADRAAVEAALREDPAARAVVDEIRAAARALESALAAEPFELPEASAAVAAPTRKARLLRFPQVYYLVGGLAAACFAVFVAMRPEHTAPKPTYTALELAPLTKEDRPPPAPAAVSEPRNDEMVTSGAAAIAARKQEETHQAARSEAKAKLAQLAGQTSQRQVFMARQRFGFGAGDAGPVAADQSRRTTREGDGTMNTEAYAFRRDSEFLAAKENPLSTFAVDVDTASYANVRRFLQRGQLPPPDAVRIEEMVNYFPFHYAPPAGEAPFAAAMEVTEAPWAPEHRLVRIGLKGREVATGARPAANLVFLLDVSGSMDAPNKLPLVKDSLRLLLGKLRPDDRVAIVVYAGASGLALPSTPVSHAAEIMAALDGLSPEGSTNGAMGIELAYDVAKAHFVPGGINRVILCTDGDFNVGVTSEGGLTRLIEAKAKSGVFLTVLGFGMGNYKDATLETLADKGNGNYGYIDTRREAEKMLVEQVSGTLVTIAKDVKIQVEFNPAKVAGYRLMGYENRMLKSEDFNNDAVDAGEIGAGHTVTALYEIVPAGATDAVPTAGGASVDPLKYQRPAVAGTPAALAAGAADELLTLKVRYKEPAGDRSRKLEFSLVDDGRRFAAASADFKFAAAVAEFGMILRESPQRGAGSLADVVTWAEAGKGNDAGGYRDEFISLVKSAQGLVR